MKHKCKFWLNNTKKDGVNIPIYFRILVNGLKAEIQTNISIPKSHYNEKKESIKPINENHELHNTEIDAWKKKYNEAVKYFLSTDDEDVVFNAFNVKMKILDKYDALLEEIKRSKKPLNQRITFQMLTDLFLTDLIDGKEHTEGTIDRYKRSALIFSDFIKDKEIHEMCANDLREYEKELLKREYKKGRLYDKNTIIRYVKHVKTIINHANQKEITSINPFAAHKSMTMIKKPISYLTLDELRVIEKRKFENIRLQELKDVFLFQCYTGMSYVDLSKFKKSDIRMIEGRMFLIKQRTKSKQTYQVPVLLKAQTILNKYNGQLPIKSNQKMNEYLKEIQALCYVKPVLTTHIARKTFATLALTKGIPIETVSKMVGHASIKTTLDAYSEVMTEKLISDMSKMEINDTTEINENMVKTMLQMMVTGFDQNEKHEEYSGSLITTMMTILKKQYELNQVA